MKSLDWAEREIEVACKRENPNWDGESFDYGCSCYKSALKAYKSLIKDNHSGMSWSITANILNRLIHNRPLTPIENTDDVWEKVGWDENLYVCKRLSGLFKEVQEDGSIKYNEFDRIICKNTHTKLTSHFGFIINIVNDMFPITFPYYPSEKPYVVYWEDFLVDEANGDFDTIGVFYVQTPEGDKVDINRYFTEVKGKFEEIDSVTYYKLKEKSK